MTILVGPAEKKWVMHENLLASKSDFFRATFRGGFREGEDGVLRLPEDGPRPFELFVGWIYSQPLNDMNGDRVRVLARPDDKKVTVRDYLGLYFFAAKYMIEDLQNETLDTLYDYYKVPGNFPRPEDVEAVYQGTGEDDKMRELLVVHTTFRMFSGYRNAGKDWADVLKDNGEIGHDLVMMISGWKLKMGTEMKKRSILPRCHFHRHQDSPTCKVEIKKEKE